MNVFKINTTAYEEEDFYLVTSLSESKIRKVIEPIVKAERDETTDVEHYDNESLVLALKRAYPMDRIKHYSEIPEISI